MSRKDEVLENLQGLKFFTTLDLKNGFYDQKHQDFNIIHDFFTNLVPPSDPEGQCEDLVSNQRQKTLIRQHITPQNIKNVIFIP